MQRTIWQIRAAFTLVELLVTVSIIALLLSILLPALGKALSAARNTVCLSNLHQIGIAWQYYLDDNDGWFPEWTGNIQWFYGGKHPAIANRPEYLGSFAKDDRLLNPYISARVQNEGRAEVFRCPSDREITNNATGESLTKGYTAYEYFGNTYVLNHLLTRYYEKPSDPYPRRPVNIKQVELHPSRVVLAGDCNWYYVGHKIWDADFHHAAPYVNMLFLDAHAAPTAFDETNHSTSFYIREVPENE